MSASSLIDSSDGGILGQLLKTIRIPEGGDVNIYTDTTGAGNDITINNSSDLTGSQLRWGFGWNGAESGGSAGSNLIIRTYDDAGTFINNMIQIFRGTGSVVLRGNSLSVPSPNRSGTFTANNAVAVVVPATGITANSVVLLTVKTPGGANAGSAIVVSTIPGASFTVTSGVADTSVYNWLIIDMV